MLVPVPSSPAAVRARGHDHARRTAAVAARHARPAAGGGARPGAARSTTRPGSTPPRGRPTSPARCAPAGASTASRWWSSTTSRPPARRSRRRPARWPRPAHRSAARQWWRSLHGGHHPRCGPLYSPGRRGASVDHIDALRVDAQAKRDGGSRARAPGAGRSSPSPMHRRKLRGHRRQGPQRGGPRPLPGARGAEAGAVRTPGLPRHPPRRRAHAREEPPPVRPLPAGRDHLQQQGPDHPRRGVRRRASTPRSTPRSSSSRPACARRTTAAASTTAGTPRRRSPRRPPACRWARRWASGATASTPSTRCEAVALLDLDAAPASAGAVDDTTSADRARQDPRGARR